ncbi:class A beta-lactamase [Ruania albidiflava]|uniref:class A beta-lactamase n=1 Tax=Ruania albidiflava TaxID=366586 RepID=UPI0003FCC349|nr:class A beta-lactamase [Ruania albidiflava]
MDEECVRQRASSRRRGPTRRSLLATGGLAAVLAATACSRQPSPAAGDAELQNPAGETELQNLEERTGRTIGLYATNLSTGREVAYRHTEPFPMCSLFKVLAVAGLLTEHSPYGDYWEEKIPFGPEDIVENSPITSAHQEREMTVSELADAALRFSDNTAGNLLLEELGGPAAVTRFARRFQATATRLDRWEPELNEAEPGDLRDTTTPADIARLYQAFLVEGRLGQLGQTRLRDWMLRNTTADERLRAALDGEYELADKTGAGEFGVVNDAGIVWRPDGSVTVISVLTRSDSRSADNDNTVLVAAARAALTAVGH